MVNEGKPSSWENVISGIPQGSVLGPLLFVIYINDLTSMTKLLADDTKVYREANNSEESKLLQKDVATLTTWPRVWQLPFNRTKCKRMHAFWVEEPTL